MYRTANETNGAKKYLEDNLHQLRRQFMTIIYLQQLRQRFARINSLERQGKALPTM